MENSMSVKLEPRTLHFDLSWFSQNREFTLLTGGGRKVVLKRYADYGSKMDEHRSRNAALRMIPEDRLRNITHFCEDVHMNASKTSMRRIVFPSLDNHPLPEIAMVFPHIPRSHVVAAHSRFYRKGRRPAHPYALGAYHVPEEQYEEMLAGAQGGNAHAIQFDAQDIQPPGVTAQAIVLHHPELGSVNPGVMSFVKDQYLNPLTNPDMSNFVQYLQNTAPGEGSYTWYNKSWAMWAENEDGSGPMVPAAVNIDLKYKNGETVTNWPKPDGADYQGLPAYNLTDQYDPPNGNPSNQSVIDAAGPSVKSTLLFTKNDNSLNGLLWTKQNGVTQRPPSPPTVTRSAAPNKATAAASRAVVADAGSSAKGFAVKNQTSSYGLDIYDLSFDATSKTVTLPLKNWPSRYLGAYVQFQKQDGTVIKRADIPNWPNLLPLEFLGPLLQPSDSKNYLDWLSSGNSIFGVPVPPLTQTSDLKFLWPDSASKALVLLGGLGCASGFKDWDNDVDVVGVLGTGIVNFGVGTIMLVVDAYVINPFLEGLKGDGKVAFYAVAGVIGASALVVGVAEKDNSFGKSILSKLGGIAASVVFGQVADRLIKAGARQFLKVFFELSAELMSELTAEEAVEAVPIAGWALRVVAVAADIAALASTTVECIVSPATYSLEVLHTMDLTVTLKPDPTHGKPGFSPVWPAVSDHYVIQVKYPSGNNQEGGTTYTKAGPMPGQHDQDIVVKFPGIPAGGKIEVVANVYSSNDWLAGMWNSGWLDAVPDANDELTASGSIVEFLVPLTSTTNYSQKQTLGYEASSKHFWAVSSFTVDASLVPDFDKGGAPDAAIQKAFSDNGDPLSSSAMITVSAKMREWMLTDSQSGATFDVNAKQIFIGTVFQISLSTYQSPLDAGGATPGSINDKFGDEQYPLPDGSQITVVTAGKRWTIALPGQLPLFELDTNGTNIDVKQTGYELTVQNKAQPAPPLPQSYPLSGSPTGNALGALQNIIINNKEFELGYAYLASGQNMPIDDQPGATDVPMYAMQSISTLGQPQVQIIQPTKGFSQPTFLAYDQFGLTPLFSLDASYASQLQNGPVSADVAKQFADFGYKLPNGSIVTVVTPNKDWTIGLPGSAPDYELRTTTVQQNGKAVQQLGIYTYPVPGLDNFFLEPQPKVQSKPLNFYLRGVKLDTPPGEYQFNYSSPSDLDIWGVFQNETPFQEMAVHPSGYVIALDNTNAKMFTLKLPATAMAPDKAPLAMPLAGKGGRPGLLDSPQAMTVTADGRILVLETGTRYIAQQRIQAFDVKGNPVPSFSVNQPSFQITNGADTIIAQLDGQQVSPALLALFQQNFTPALAPKAVLSDSLSSVTADLDQSTVDGTLLATLQQYGLAGDAAKTTDFKVAVTTAGKLWFVTDTVSSATYDVRLVTDPSTEFNALDVFLQFGLSIMIQSAGNNWKIEDSVNGMTFGITKAAKSSTLTVQELSSWMPLRTQSVKGSLSYLDIASETKGYIYVLGVIDNNYNSTKDPADLVFQLDIYNPDGSPLLNAPQTGLNAGKITVDQYRSLFSLNFNVVIGPNSRTEPGVSQWIPSTPAPAT
jgi:hypothetical protein